MSVKGSVTSFTINGERVGSALRVEAPGAELVKLDDISTFTFNGKVSSRKQLRLFMKKAAKLMEANLDE